METVADICSSIFSELLLIWSLLEDNIFLIDLFMEQLLLCGLMGFEEFLDRAYIEFINHWMRSLECDGNLCNDHTMGVGLAVECLLIARN